MAPDRHRSQCIAWRRGWVARCRTVGAESGWPEVRRNRRIRDIRYPVAASTGGQRWLL